MEFFLLFGVVGFGRRVPWLYLSIHYDFLLLLNTGACRSAFYSFDLAGFYHNPFVIFILFVKKLASINWMAYF
ncbi:MAG: hypothetical protein ACI9Y1_003550 [Lentisphaeria bacterium]